MKRYISCSRDESSFLRINRNIWDILSDASSNQSDHNSDKDEIYQAVSAIKNLCWKAQEELEKIDQLYDINVGL